MAEELYDFEAMEKSRYENISFVKRVVLCSFTEILFQRKLLPDEAFKAIRLDGMKLYIFDANNDDAYENLVKLNKICEEIEDESVKILRFLINFSSEGEELVGELFEINFVYGESVTLILKLGETIEHLRYDSRTHKRTFNLFIMRLRQFLRMLRVLPDGSYGRYHVVYKSGKKMRDNTCEYFTKVLRAPIVWKGPQQDICGIVGKFHGQEIGLKMSVGTLFGTGATDSNALAEHLKEENMIDGEWEEQSVNVDRTFHDNKLTDRHASYKKTAMDDERKEHDSVQDTSQISKMLQRDGYECVRYSSSESAQRGSDIDSQTVMAMDEEANEKEGRMEKRRRRRKLMMEKKIENNTTLRAVAEQSGISLRDIEKVTAKTPGDSKSTTNSSDTSLRTPGMGAKKYMNDTNMHSDSEGEENVRKEMSSVEQAIVARKKRLMEMKSRMNGLEMKIEDYLKEDSATKKSKDQEKTFRSYKPVDSNVGEKSENIKTNLRAVEEEIEEQLRLANDTSHVDKIDLQALAPKKVDWDLKRDLSAKLDKLERRTQAGIAHLIRERLAEGNTDLAEAVASAH